jgi:uncharacterized protein involved in exopolysaccharide biosynthesis
MPEDKRGNTARDVLRTVFRRRWLFLGTAGLVSILMLVLVQHWPLSYTGTGVLEVMNKEVLTVGGKSESGYTKLRKTAQIWMRSQQQIEKALEDLGRFKGLPSDEQGRLTEAGQRKKQDIIRDTMENLTVKPQVSSESLDRYVISFTSPDQELAQRLPNELMDNFEPMLSREILNQLKEQQKHLIKQVDDAQDALNNARAAKMQYEKNKGRPASDISYLDREIQDVADQIDSMKGELEIAQLRLQSYRNVEKRGQDEQADETVVPVVGPNPVVAELEDQIETAEEGLEILLKVQKKTEKHPDVIQQRSQIALLKEKLADEPREIELERHIYPSRNGELGPVFQIEMTASRIRVENLQRSLKQKQESLAELQQQRMLYPTRKPEWDKLVKAEEKAQDKLTNLRQEAEKVERNLGAEAAGRRTGVITRELADYPYRPSSPKLFMVIGLSLGAGLAAGAGLIFLSHIMDRTISTPEEAAAQFNLPVHGVIAEIVTPQVKRRRKLTRAFVVPLIAILLTAGIGLGILSNWLRLERPSEYATFRATPMHYLSQEFVKPVRDSLGL